MAKESREMVWLQCTETGDLNYRTEIKVAGGPQKNEVKKYSPRLRRHTLHKVKRKGIRRGGFGYTISATGRAAVSKAAGWGFDSLLACFNNAGCRDGVGQMACRGVTGI